MKQIDLDLIEEVIKTMEIEDLTISQEALEIYKHFLNQEITSEQARNKIIEIYK